MLSNGSTEIVGINDMISRSLFFELALISIFGFARTWNTVVAHKEGMSIGYTIIRHLGLLCAYCYVCKLISCIVSSNSPNSAYKAHKIVLYSLLFVVSVTMFFISYTWQPGPAFRISHISGSLRSHFFPFDFRVTFDESTNNIALPCHMSSCF